MKVEITSQVKIKVKGVDIENLKTAIQKVVEDSKKVGFKANYFTEEEKKVLVKLSDSLKKEGEK